MNLHRLILVCLSLNILVCFITKDKFKTTLVNLPFKQLGTCDTKVLCLCWLENRLAGNNLICLFLTNEFSYFAKVFLFSYCECWCELDTNDYSDTYSGANIHFQVCTIYVPYVPYGHMVILTFILELISMFRYVQEHAATLGAAAIAVTCLMVNI